MSITPFVSILLPTYNRVHLLPRAVESVLQQTYKNGNSLSGMMVRTTKPLIIVRGLVISELVTTQKKPWDVVCTESRNCSIKRKVSRILDDDDEWAENKLEVQLAFR
jgi:glycosyltransferase involved in cell wall biosynthesis